MFEGGLVGKGETGDGEGPTRGVPVGVMGTHGAMFGNIEACARLLGMIDGVPTGGIGGVTFGTKFDGIGGTLGTC